MGEQNLPMYWALDFDLRFIAAHIVVACCKNAQLLSITEHCPMRAEQERSLCGYLCIPKTTLHFFSTIRQLWPYWRSSSVHVPGFPCPAPTISHIDLQYYCNLSTCTVVPDNRAVSIEGCSGKLSLWASLWYQNVFCISTTTMRRFSSRGRSEFAHGSGPTSCSVPISQLHTAALYAVEMHDLYDNGGMSTENGLEDRLSVDIV